ncbi:MAG: nucleoside hydrolase [Spirochaetes bacterium]|nr:nucleoside hydrolase [Spirochaetota bacterium]
MKKIILDCDPGHDDMIAIMLAEASEEIELLGITTVAGNQAGEKTFTNTLKILTLMGEKDIPVARGFDKPIVRDLTVAPEIHGVSGLDGARLPEPDMPPSAISDMHAVDFIISTLLKENTSVSSGPAPGDEKIYLVPTGPLTNIAVALIKAPEIKKRIERIVLMGGAVYDSNVTPAAEFNIFVDPEAAEIVFKSGIPVTMVGLDVSNKSVFTFEDINHITAMRGRVSGIVGPLLHFFAHANYEIFRINGAPLHDPLTVAYLIDGTILTTKNLHVDIETNGEFTRGRTVADIYGVTGKKPNADVALKVDVDKFKKLVFDAIKKLDLRGL